MTRLAPPSAAPADGPLSVLVLSGFFAPDLVGGAEVSALNIATQLTERGHNVVVLRSGAGTRARQPYTVGKISVFVLRNWRPYPLIERHKGLRQLVWHAVDHLDIAAFAQVLRMVRQHNPDVAIIHTTQGLGPLALAALKVCRVPTVQFMHDYGRACINRGFFRIGRTCDRHCLPCIGSRLWQTACSPNETIFVAPSRYVLKSVHELGATRRLGLVVRNPNEYLKEQGRARSHGRIRLLFVGRFETEKGIDLLLAAAALAKREVDFTLAFVGYGSLDEKIRAHAEENEWVSIIGRLTQQQVMAEIDSSDAVICPSIWPENYAGVVVQSLVAGKPVLASANGGTGEIITDDENGMLFGTDGVEDLQRSIVKFVSDRAVRERLSAGARSWSANYDPGRPMGRLLRLLNRLAALNKKNRGKTKHVDRRITP